MAKSGTQVPIGERPRKAMQSCQAGSSGTTGNFRKLDRTSANMVAEREIFGRRDREDCPIQPGEVPADG